MNRIINKEKAITLIALVITIVVLIILATVAINLSLGNNGIFNRAKTAKEQYQNAQEYEETQIAKATNEINGYVDGNRDGENDYIEIKDEDAKKIITYSKNKYSVNTNTLFNDSEYINNIINSDEAINYIISNGGLLNKAIDSQHMMRTLLTSSKKNDVVTKLTTKSYINPRLTSANGSDGGNCFGTDTGAMRTYWGIEIWHGFTENKEYALGGNGDFNLGYKFNSPIWCFKFSFKQRASNMGVDNLIVQYSDDGNNWIDATSKITTIRNTDEQEHIIDNAIGKHLYWRIKGNGYGTDLGLRNLKFYGIN